MTNFIKSTMPCSTLYYKQASKQLRQRQESVDYSEGHTSKAELRSIAACCIEECKVLHRSSLPCFVNIRHTDTEQSWQKVLEKGFSVRSFIPSLPLLPTL